MTKKSIEIQQIKSIMKKFLLSLALIAAGLIVSDSAYAQCAKSASANKSCCASKASTASADTNASSAILTAMTEQGVKKTVCETTGSVSYHIENTAPDGSVASTQEVAFDESMGKFVNVSPAKACCAKGSAEAKACDKKEASTGKACCASKADKSTK